MACTTKAAVEQQVADMAAQIEALNAALAQANAALVQAQDALTLASAQQQAHSTPSRRVAAAMPAWQAERAASMALAREMAMRSGHTTKVAV